MAMMAITTSNSIRVKAPGAEFTSLRFDQTRGFLSEVDWDFFVIITRCRLPSQWPDRNDNAQRFHGFTFGSGKNAGLSAVDRVIVWFEVQGCGRRLM